MDHRLGSPWLSDWRAFADEIDMPPAVRRSVAEAIHRTESSWATRHEGAYRRRFQNNRTARNEKVVGACDEMSRRLKEIRSDLATGRLTPTQARGEVRDMQARHRQIMALHDTLVAEDEQIEAFAAMTPDDYQRQQVGDFPILIGHQPSLQGLMAEIGRVPAGGRSLPRDDYVPTHDAPSEDDLR